MGRRNGEIAGKGWSRPHDADDHLKLDSYMHLSGGFHDLSIIPTHYGVTGKMKFAAAPVISDPPLSRKPHRISFVWISSLQRCVHGQRLRGDRQLVGAFSSLTETAVNSTPELSDPPPTRRIPQGRGYLSSGLVGCQTSCYQVRSVRRGVGANDILQIL